MMTKEEILDAAAQIFRIKGYHATSMSDIAGAVNLQKASLYHHVSSKQEILLALLDEALGMILERLENVAHCQPPLFEAASPSTRRASFFRQAVAAPDDPFLS